MAQKIDLKIKPEKAGKEDSVVTKPYYPSIYIEKELPFEGKDVGKTIMVKVKMKLTSYNERKVDGSDVNSSFGFDIMEMTILDGAVEAVKEHMRKK